MLVRRYDYDLRISSSGDCGRAGYPSTNWTSRSIPGMGQVLLPGRKYVWPIPGLPTHDVTLPPTGQDRRAMRLVKRRLPSDNLTHVAGSVGRRQMVLG